MTSIVHPRGINVASLTSSLAPLAIVSAVLTVAASGCVRQPPAPLDTAALPSATTTAKPEYISTEPTGDSENEKNAAAADGTNSSLQNPALQLGSSRALPDARSASCPRPHCWRSWLVPRPNEIQTAAVHFTSFAANTTAMPPSSSSGGSKARATDTSVQASPVAVWQEQLRPNTKLDFPRTKNLSFIGLVVDGVLTAEPSEGGQLAALKSWSLFYAPGSGVTLKTDNNEASVVLIAYARQGTLDQALATLKKSETAVYWEKRPGAWSVDDLERASQTACAPTGCALYECSKTPMNEAKLQLLVITEKSPIALASTGWQQVLLPLQGQATVSPQPNAPKNQAQTDQRPLLQTQLATPIIVPSDAPLSVQPEKRFVAARVLVPSEQGK